jgi:hypothetical protein
VQTVFLRTLSVVFFIEISTRRVHMVGATAHPHSAWVTQQARNLALEERLTGIRFLLRDRDAKFSGPFDEVIRTEEVRVICTPIRAPKANAFAERFVRTVRSESLDHVPICGRRHLDWALRCLRDPPHGAAAASGGWVDRRLAAAPRHRLEIPRESGSNEGTSSAVSFTSTSTPHERNF